MSRSRIGCWMVCLSLVSQFAAAAPPRPDQIKVAIRRADGRNRPVIFKAAELGATDVAAYAGYRLVSIPKAALHGLEQQLRARGLYAERRDDFDVLSLPGGRIDTRTGLDAAIPRNERIDGYAFGVNGLHAVQLIGPPTSDWLKTIAQAGAEIVAYVPQNGYLLAARADEAAAIGRLAFVQWISPYHPFHKAKPATRSLQPTEVELELADVDGVNDTLSRLCAKARASMRAMRIASLCARRPTPPASTSY